MAVIRFPPNQSFNMKPHVQRFANDMEAYFGGAMNWGSYAGHSPPEGPTQALDHFNPNSPAGHAQQDKAAEWAIRNAKKYGLRYIIKRAKIWNIERAAEGWRSMKVTGNQTVDHMDHNHYTFYAVAAGGGEGPSKPIEEEDDMQSNWFRYVYGGQDWVVDRLAKKVGATTHADQLKALDKLGCVAIGQVSEHVDAYFKGQYQ